MRKLCKQGRSFFGLVGFLKRAHKKIQREDENEMNFEGAIAFLGFDVLTWFTGWIMGICYKCHGVVGAMT